MELNSCIWITFLLLVFAGVYLGLFFWVFLGGGGLFVLLWPFDSGFFNRGSAFRKQV